jgi:hypothetical protein
MITSWTDIKQRILDEINKPNDGELVDQALIEALKFHRSDTWWFNQGTWEVRTVADQSTYPLPTDFVSLIDNPFLTQSTENNNDRRILENRTQEWIDAYQNHQWDYWEAELSTGPPRGCAIVHPDNVPSIFVAPIPTQADWRIDGRYYRDFDIPYRRYISSAWAMYHSGTNTALEEADYTSPWLEGIAGDLIAARAMYYLASRFYSDPNATQTYLLLWSEIKNQMITENYERASIFHPRGYL